MRKILITFFALLLTSSKAIAGISDAQLTSGAFSVSGAGFGSGPTVSLYDNFDDGTHGENIDFQATIGAWSGTSTNPPTYDDVISWSTSRGRGLSMQGGDVDCGGYSTNCEETRQLQYTHGSMATEFYVSFLVMVPNGSYFPYTLSTETFPAPSAWKMNWFSVGDSAVANDMIIPSWIGSKFVAGGNSGVLDPDEIKAYDNYVDLGDENAFWAWGDWVRFTMYVKGNDADPYGYSGTVKVTAESAVGKFEFSDASTKCFLEEYGYGITQWRFNGWMRTQGTVEQQHMVKPVYDDIYIATGANALKRVELGNAPIFANCTHREIQPALTWSDTGITGTFNQGSFETGDTVYFFVVDEEGVPSDGYAVVIGGEIPIANPIVNILTESGQTTTASIFEITGTATADTGQSISVVTCEGQIVTPDDGTWDEQVESFTCLANLSIGENVLTFIGSDGTRIGSDSVTITRTIPGEYTTRGAGFSIKGCTLK